MSAVSVVIVTWNAADFIDACLRTVPEGVQVIVVDNASTDSTASVVEGSPRDVILVRNAENRGFAAAANQGIETATGDHVLLLNPDAQMEPGTVERLRRVLTDDRSAAVASAFIVDGTGEHERQSCGREPTPLTVLVHELGVGRWLRGLSLYGEPRDEEVAGVDWVAGTCVLIHHDDLQTMGGFDERYFLYCEDIDLCRRLRESGRRIVVVRNARTIHHRSTSVNLAGPWIDRYRIGSLDTYVRSRHGRSATAFVRFARLLGAVTRAGALAIAALVSSRSDLAARARQRRHDSVLPAQLLFGHPPEP